MRKLILALGLLLAPFCWAIKNDTIVADGTYVADLCRPGTARLSLIDGGSGWDSTTATLQYRNAEGNWQNACETAADCQWTADTGIIGLTVFAPTWYRISADTGTDSADIDVELFCGGR